MGFITKAWGRLRGHFQQYVSRYAVLAVAVLTPASALLGALAADLGGADTQAGRIAYGAAAALGTAIAGITFIRNLGIWQMLDQFGVAPHVPPAALPVDLSAHPVGANPDEALGADDEALIPALPVSPDVERPAVVEHPSRPARISPEQAGEV